MLHSKLISALVVALLVLAGCSHGPLQPDHGDAISYNKRAQAVDPVAGRGDIPVATLDGQKSEKLLKGYRTDSGKAATSSIIDVSK